MTRLPLLLAALVGCSDPPPVLECDGNSVSGTISSGPTDDTFRSDTFTVTGTVLSSGIAVRTVTVGNVAAHADSTNFGTWTASIPIGTLLSLASGVEDSDGDGVIPVELSAVATDACGDQYPIGATFSVPVDLTPDTRVDSLALAVTLPSSGASFIPVDGTTPAILTLTANADARDATVQLATSRGTLLPGTSVVLAGDGTQAATATFLLVGDSPDDAGTALLTATVEDFLASASVNLADGPVLYPATAAVSAGAEQVITATSDGDLDECWAVGGDSTNLTVMAGEQSLYDGPVEDGDGDGVIEIHVAQVGDVASEASVRIVCCDRYHQCTNDAGSDANAGVYTYTPESTGG